MAKCATASLQGSPELDSADAPEGTVSSPQPLLTPQLDPPTRRLLLALATLGSSATHALAQDPALIGPPSPDPACSNPPADQCGFYADCLESRYRCGPGGYPLSYGQHFCQKFSDDRNLLSDAGRRWMVDTMQCLQRALVPDAVDADPPSLSCETLKDKAFASHVGCYTSNRFCELGLRDWMAVLEILNVTTLVSSWGAFKGTVETAGSCAAFYAGMVKGFL